LLLYCSNGFRTALTNVVGLEAECIGFAAESLLLTHDSLSTAEFGFGHLPLLKSDLSLFGSSYRMAGF